MTETLMTAQDAYDVDIEDVAYLRHGQSELRTSIFRPRGPGPFPMLIDLHGGAWCNGDRHNNKALCETLARRGILVAALDFRQPPQAPYPGAMADINFGIRWLKAHAENYSGDPRQMGLIGISSGGQQAMLAAMRPDDPRYAEIDSPETSGQSAAVGGVILCWPVIDPLGRYQYAKRRVAADDGYPQQLPSAIPNHEKYWQTKQAMSEGSPLQILERGDDISMPPVLYLQGEDDEMHPRADLDRFVKLYTERGGALVPRITLNVALGSRILVREQEGARRRCGASSSVPDALTGQNTGPQTNGFRLCQGAVRDVMPGITSEPQRRHGRNPFVLIRHLR